MFSTKFSFSTHRKSIFYFLSAERGGICEATTKLKFQNCNIIFFKNTRPPSIYNVPTLASQTFCSIPGEKDNSCRIGKKWVRYELHVHDFMLMIFCKNYF